MTYDSCSIIEEFLKQVKAGNIAERGFGLCWNFRCFCESHYLFYPEDAFARESFERMLCTFPKYTGNSVYPLVPSKEYEAHLNAEVDFYDPTTSYGAIRLEFVEWALKELAQNEASYMKS